MQEALLKSEVCDCEKELCKESGEEKFVEQLQQDAQHTIHQLQVRTGWLIMRTGWLIMRTGWLHG